MPVDEADEVQCVDCGCDIIRDEELSDTEQRCDTDRDHHDRDCGEDCPVICDLCLEHHFEDDLDCDGMRPENQERSTAERLAKGWPVPDAH
jgi:hypothetical protein